MVKEVSVKVSDKDLILCASATDAANTQVIGVTDKSFFIEQINKNVDKTTVAVWFKTKAGKIVESFDVEVDFNAVEKQPQPKQQVIDKQEKKVSFAKEGSKNGKQKN